MKFKDLDLSRAFRRQGWLQTYPSWEHKNGLNYPLKEEQHVYMGFTDTFGEDWVNTDELTINEMVEENQLMGLYDESKQSND